MPQITIELLRKRAEHNEGLISTLEEISLHQEELESINDVIRTNCKRLKILYLQNNIIPKIQNLKNLKELEYLNLAINNISKIEGLDNCEFLHKLDLTLNFIDMDELESSAEHLSQLPRLRELYMMGNPSQVNWPGFNSYLIAKLPTLELLDGKEVSKSMKIIAQQQLSSLKVELSNLANLKRQEKLCKLQEKSATTECSSLTHSICEDEQNKEEGEKLTENTPEARVEIYQELAAQKKAKEDRQKENAPRERNYTKEQLEIVEKVRGTEKNLDESEIKQKNEGGWSFSWDEDKIGVIGLNVEFARHLDSSLIDVDVHPTYVSIVVKSKLLRLRLPVEVKAGESKCQRSKITGHLLITMPIANPSKSRVESIFIKPKTTTNSLNKNRNSSDGTKSTKSEHLVEKKTKIKSIQEQMHEIALEEKEKSKTLNNNIHDIDI